MEEEKQTRYQKYKESIKRAQKKWLTNEENRKKKIEKDKETNKKRRMFEKDIIEKYKKGLLVEKK
jgi:hypothetical protein